MASNANLVNVEAIANGTWRFAVLLNPRCIELMLVVIFNCIIYPSFPIFYPWAATLADSPGLAARHFFYFYRFPWRPSPAYASAYSAGWQIAALGNLFNG
jgi:hypothetical protein